MASQALMEKWHALMSRRGFDGFLAADIVDVEGVEVLRAFGHVGSVRFMVATQYDGRSELEILFDLMQQWQANMHRLACHHGENVNLCLDEIERLEGILDERDANISLLELQLAEKGGAEPCIHEDAPD